MIIVTDPSLWFDRLTMNVQDDKTLYKKRKWSGFGVGVLKT
jgi:hypothetical protein